MPPHHIEHWMEANLDWLGMFPIKEVVCLPGSHDAGMSTAHHLTKGGGAAEDNTLTQSHDILGQLQWGARWFDIRPYWVEEDNEWRCGHFNMCDAIGWQGATGLSILEVCQQVNKFLEDHNELVILRITHVANVIKGGDLDLEKDKDLLNLLFGKLDKVRKVTREGPKDHENDCVVIEDMKLGDLISGKGCVIVTTRNHDGNDIKDEAWRQVKIERTDYNPGPVGLAIAQSNIQAALSSDWGKLAALITGNLTSKSLKAVAQEYQKLVFPTKPQELFAQKICVPVSMDEIKDDRLLTLCLAASRAKWFAMQGNTPKQRVVYVRGGRLIDNDPSALDQIEAGVKSFSTFKVPGNNSDDDETGGSSCVFYLETKNKNNPKDWLFGKGRFALRGDDIDFRVDIDSIRWGGQFLTEWAFRVGYFNLFQAITRGQGFDANPDQFDKAPNSQGDQRGLILQYRSWSGQHLKQRNVQEGRTEDFSNDIDWITYGDQIIPSPVTYEHFFWVIERDGPIEITNRLMGGGSEDFDPSIGNKKRVRMKWKAEGVEQADWFADGDTTPVWRITDRRGFILNAFKEMEKLRSSGRLHI